MVSIDEVARLAGVSTATVSRALSGRGNVSAATRARVEAATESLGYVVSASASSLASGRTRNIGVLVPFLDRWFFSTVLNGVASALMRRGYDITLYNLTTDPDVRRSIFETFLRRQRVDGVIAVSIELGTEETARLSELDLPVIAIGGPNPRLSTLAVDDVAVARLATEHLLALGHRDIAHIGASPEFDIDFHIPTQRRQGFEQAMADAGIPARPALYEPADFTIEGGFRAAKQLLGGRAHGRPRSSPPPTRWRSGRCSPPASSAIGCPRTSPSSASTATSSASSSASRRWTSSPSGRANAPPTRSSTNWRRGDAAPVRHDPGELPYELVVRGTTARPTADPSPPLGRLGPRSTGRRTPAAGAYLRRPHNAPPPRGRSDAQDGPPRPCGRLEA